jgi:signal transduction histidine kinase
VPPPFRRPPAWAVDARIVVPLLLIGVFGTRGAAAHGQPDARPLDHWAYLLVVAAVLSLLARRRSPWLTVLVNTAAVATYLAVGYPFGPILLTVPVVAFGLAVHWPRPQAVLAVGAELLVLLAASVLRVTALDHGGSWSDLARGWLVWAPVVAAAFALGATARVRRESWAGVRAEQARRAASEEQLRMAQELHDVVGHGLAVIAMQAGVALHVLDREPDKARESLEAIRTMSRESLDGLRTELAQLRAGAGDAPERRPLPGLADLHLLVARSRAGGVDVRLDVSADLATGELPTEVGAAAYRIVQESLTNVLRHADAGQASVTVRPEDGELVVTVTDRGRGGEPGGDGTGIRGMRERTAALGGTCEAGPTADGFRVVARLPLDPEPEPAGQVR